MARRSPSTIAAFAYTHRTNPLKSQSRGSMELIPAETSLVVAGAWNAAILCDVHTPISVRYLRFNVSGNVFDVGALPSSRSFICRMASLRSTAEGLTVTTTTSGSPAWAMYFPWTRGSPGPAQRAQPVDQAAKFIIA
jgi:hypothetical protein